MPWCPKCSIEYRDGFTQCSDCQIELVDELSESSSPLREQLDDTPKEEPPIEPKFPGLTTRSRLLVSVLFMFVYSWLDRHLMWWIFDALSWNFDLSMDWSIGFFQFNNYLSPILFNLLFFTGLHFILHRQKWFGYLTLRNTLLVAGITIGGRLASYVLIFPLDLVLFHDSQPGIAVMVIGMLIGNLPGILILALIYRFTIGGLPFKKLFFTKTAAGALILATLALTVQAIYIYHFFIPSPLFSPWDSFSPSALDTMAMGNHTVWLFRLHLLWVGLLLGRPVDPRLPDDLPKPAEKLPPIDDSLKATAKGIRVLFWGGLLGIVISTLGLVNFATAYLASVFTVIEIWLDSTWYSLATSVGDFVVVYGLCLLCSANRYFKRALVLHIIHTLIGLATIMPVYPIIVFSSVVATLRPIIDLAVLFHIFWGVACIATGSGLPKLARQFKRLFWVHLLFIPFIFIVALIAFVFLGFIAQMISVLLFAVFVILFVFIALGVYELYLLRFTYTQLESDAPKDINDVFSGGEIKAYPSEISSLAEPKARKKVARFYPDNARHRWRVLGKRQRDRL